MNAQTSLLSDFLNGRALPEQWLGVLLLAVILIVGVVALTRLHVRDVQDESRGRR